MKPSIYVRSPLVENEAIKTVRDHLKTELLENRVMETAKTITRISLSLELSCSLTSMKKN